MIIHQLTSQNTKYKYTVHKTFFVVVVWASQVLLQTIRRALYNIYSKRKRKTASHARLKSKSFYGIDTLSYTCMYHE